MPLSGSQGSLADRLAITEQSNLDWRLLRRILQTIDADLNRVKGIASGLQEVQDELRQVALDRINAILTPAIESVLEIQERGFLVGTSSTPGTLGSGNVLTLYITEGAERDLFTPAPFTVLMRAGSVEDWAVARTIAYARENGAYLCEVVGWQGDPGPHSDWTIAAIAGSTLAQLAWLEEGKAAAQLATAKAGEAVAARDEAVPAAAFAGQKAAEALQHKQDAEEAAQAAQTFDPANFYNKTEVDGALGEKQATSEKGQANGYAGLDAEGRVPEAQLPDLSPDYATQEQAEAGAADNVSMSPLRVAEAIAALAGDMVMDAPYTESGTFTKDPDDIAYFVQAVGAGGSGGLHTGNFNAGGGHPGEVVEKWVFASEIPSTAAITIGQGGAARSGGSAADGNPGGNSSFGDKVVAAGGIAGPNNGGNIRFAKSHLLGQVNKIDTTDASALVDTSTGEGGWNSREFIMFGNAVDYGSVTVRAPTPGGGANSSTGRRAANSSEFGKGGNGNGGSGGVAGDGQAPGGGGGGKTNGGASGAGARGEIKVWRLKRKKQ